MDLSLSQIMAMQRDLYDLHAHEWSPLEPEFGKDSLLYMMEEVGGDTIELIPNGSKQKRIWVGRNSPLYFWVSDTTIDRLVEDAADNQLFSSPALDYVKTEMKKGI